MSAFPNSSPDRSPAAWAASAAARMEQAGLFFGHGTECAFDEACWMLSHVLALPPDFSESDAPKALDATTLGRLESLLQRRVDARTPLAYLIGEAWFAGLRFEVDTATLVPRSPLAEVATGGLEPWLDFGDPLHVLEIGTGSGCIAAALAWYWPNLRIDATDIEAAALDCARGNIARLGLGDRVELIQSDVYDSIEGRRYDLIVSNPPYVPEAQMEQLPEEYRREPRSALAAGRDGLDVFRRLLAGAADHLQPGGWLLVELGEAAPAAEAMLESVAPIWLEFEHGGDGVVLIDDRACQSQGARAA